MLNKIKYHLNILAWTLPVASLGLVFRATSVYLDLIVLNFSIKCCAFLTPNIIRTIGLTALSKVIPFIPELIVNHLAFITPCIPIFILVAKNYYISPKNRSSKTSAALMLGSTVLFAYIWPAIAVSNFRIALASCIFETIKVSPETYKLVRGVVVKSFIAQPALDIESYCNNHGERPKIIQALNIELDPTNTRCPITLDDFTEQSAIIMLLSKDPAGNIKATMISDNAEHRNNYLLKGNTDPLTRGEIVAFETTTINKIKQKFLINKLDTHNTTAWLPSFSMSREHIPTFYSIRQNVYNLAANITGPRHRPSAA